MEQYGHVRNLISLTPSYGRDFIMAIKEELSQGRIVHEECREHVIDRERVAVHVRSW